MGGAGADDMMTAIAGPRHDGYEPASARTLS